jgi:membrane-associated phospholipid phosphatase
MIADSHASTDAPIDPPLDGRRVSWSASWMERLTSVWALAIGLLVVTLLAMGPLNDVDYLLAHRWLYRIEPDLLWFAENFPDRIASQAVCLPVMGLVAIIIARRRRSWRPIVLGAMAEASFLVGVGSLKLLMARPVTNKRNPEFFDGGFFSLGAKGISFPSGHAAESVLIYGMAVYLIAHYTFASRRLVRLLCWGVVAISVNSVTVSFLLGWHWASDLIGGLLAGGLFLRIIMLADERCGRPRLGERSLRAAAR